jgi:hypothetical protein
MDKEIAGKIGGGTEVRLPDHYTPVSLPDALGRVMALYQFLSPFTSGHDKNYCVCNVCSTEQALRAAHRHLFALAAETTLEDLEEAVKSETLDA